MKQTYRMSVTNEIVQQVERHSFFYYYVCIKKSITPQTQIPKRKRSNLWNEIYKA